MPDSPNEPPKLDDQDEWRGIMWGVCSVCGWGACPIMPYMPFNTCYCPICDKQHNRVQEPGVPPYEL